MQTAQQFRRVGDEVSPINADMLDQSRLLQEAVRMVDHMGLSIVSAEAQASPRNQRIQVMDQGPEGMLKLFPDAVEQRRTPGWSVWVTNRYGVEIRWCRAHKEAA